MSAGSAAATAAGFAAGTFAYSLTSIVVSGTILSIFGEKQKELDASGITANKQSNNNPIPVIAGRVRVGGTICYMGLEGDSNEYMNIILGLGEGELEFHNIYFNGVIDDSLAQIIEFKSGAADQSACSLYTHSLKSGSYWSDEHKLSGTAYVYVQLKYDRDKFPSGVPTITLDVSRKNNLYDPRTEKFDGRGDNNALFLRDYLTNDNYGRGLTNDDINDTSFIAMANYCDQLVHNQKRYTVNGVLNTNISPRENVLKILGACLGSLVFSQGKYQLIIDRPDIPVISFDEDNIVGKWSFALESKRNRLNRVKINYINDKGIEDIAIVDSDELRVIDNGLLLEKTLRLPFVRSSKRAKQIGTVIINQSRQQQTCKFNTAITDKTLSAEIGDLAYVKHPTPGWMNMNNNKGKLFRIADAKFLKIRQMQFTLIEYDASSYNVDAVVADDPTKDTDYPDGRTVLPPTNLKINEELYVTTKTSSVKTKLKISWDAPLDFSVYNYLVEWKYTDIATYTYSETVAKSMTFFDVEDKEIKVNIYAQNALQVKSEALTLTYKIKGITEKPADLTGLSLIVKGELGEMQWDKSNNLDVKIGGRIEIRHSDQLDGWNNAILLNDGIPGGETKAVVPVLVGQYYAKFVDAKNNYSLKAASFQLVTRPKLFFEKDITNLRQNPNFSGLKQGFNVVNNALISTQEKAVYNFDQSFDMVTAKALKLHGQANVVGTSSATDDEQDNMTAGLQFSSSSGFLKIGEMAIDLGSEYQLGYRDRAINSNGIFTRSSNDNNIVIVYNDTLFIYNIKQKSLRQKVLPAFKVHSVSANETHVFIFIKKTLIFKYKVAIYKLEDLTHKTFNIAANTYSVSTTWGDKVIINNKYIEYDGVNIVEKTLAISPGYSAGFVIGNKFYIISNNGRAVSIYDLKNNIYIKSVTVINIPPVIEYAAIFFAIGKDVFSFNHSNGFLGFIGVYDLEMKVIKHISTNPINFQVSDWTGKHFVHYDKSKKVLSIYGESFSPWTKFSLSEVFCKSLRFRMVVQTSVNNAVTVDSLNVAVDETAINLKDSGDVVENDYSLGFSGNGILVREREYTHDATFSTNFKETPSLFINHKNPTSMSELAAYYDSASDWSSYSSSDIDKITLEITFLDDKNFSATAFIQTTNATTGDIVELKAPISYSWSAKN